MFLVGRGLGCLLTSVLNQLWASHWLLLQQFWQSNEVIGCCKEPEDGLGFGGGALGFERQKETLHCRIVSDIAGPARGAGDTVVCQQTLELLADMQNGTGLAKLAANLAYVPLPIVTD